MTTRAASRQHHEKRRGDEANSVQQRKPIRALTTIQRWWRLQKQIALNGIDRADYHGEDFDDEL
jgi:hypothetical protein